MSFGERVVVVVTAESLAPATSPPGPAELQSRLFDLGYYDGPVDGRISELTVAALARFQHDHGLPATGLPDALTTQTMHESYCY